MRIVAVADTHTYERDLGAIPDGDVFVHAGDLLLRGALAELDPVVAWIHALPHRWKVVVAGNHDWCFASDRDAARARLGDITYLEDAGVTLGGLQIWGSPWQPTFNDWAFNLPRGPALAEKWAAISEGVDVLVTHGPPLGFGDMVPGKGRVGCSDLLDRVRVARPRAHLFGHIHEDGGGWRDGATSFFNVTTWEGERAPTVLDVDRDTITAVTVPPRR